MRLESLQVEQLPGLTQPLFLNDITAGVTVVVGPNASGKSSLVRALMAVLYPREHEGVLQVEAEFRSAAGTVLTARRLGRDVAWEHDGRAGPPPALPPFHLVGAYSVRLEDLVAADRPAATTTRQRGRPRAGQRSESGVGGGAVDDAIAAAIVKELSGGIDIAAVRSGIGAQAEAGQKLARAVREATNERKRLADARAALREREERLP